jgi:hypothetical protein
VVLGNVTTKCQILRLTIFPKANSGKTSMQICNIFTSKAGTSHAGEEKDKKEKRIEGTGGALAVPAGSAYADRKQN